MKFAHAGVSLRPYHCRDCGRYHLTSKAEMPDRAVADMDRRDFSILNKWPAQNSEGQKR